MEEIRDIRLLYCKLHKYRKLGEKLLGISINRTDRYTFGLEHKISKLYKFVFDNMGWINYDVDILSHLSRLISYGDVGFKGISGTPEYRVFYEIRKLGKLVNKISDHVKYTEGTMEYNILMESDRFSDRFEYLIKTADNIKEIIDRLRINKDQENLVHSNLLNERNKYVKLIRSTKLLPVMIGNGLRGKPGRVEVKLNCGVVRPKLSGIYVLPYDYLKKRYSNEFISINYEQDLEILPNRKEIECRGETVKLDKVCILRVTGDVGEILMTYKYRYYMDHCLYPFSEGSFYAEFSTFMLKSILK
jgi:hypothetical protein